ncbi:hypothetical protein TTHERM_00486370 (macronuclear) [Tetrahymena thermophila SB210]|uniref:BTB/POZ domain protein n=1 Tax=Tetrahymena thermophila (strain SB210) TaxID=312017 RepID=I7LTG2_TETTS|nr:hypothetical protein TTHERM_00486370 [Tetrahymena thermophila SB210]EAR85186.2 hypothetical protein TTHERM_00486370 [Tetrahymena thermophila SB210]|eukprot:XP_001032849.2 hypothetical protein TTHERM_00486370 [Tetrahymena thermophila SB210]
MLNLNTKQASQQRKSSDFSNTNIQKTVSQDDTYKIVLIIHANPKLEKIFSNDINPNIVIKSVTKSFSLNKGHLRVESGFFERVFKENEAKKEIQLDIQFFKEEDEGILEKILRCLYGGKSIIIQQEFYQTYKMCKHLEIQKLVQLLNSEVLNNFNMFNFFTVFQLAVLYSEYDLLKRAQTFLEDTSFEIVKEAINQDRKNLPYPVTFADLDQEAARQILNFNKDFTYLDPIETFNLIQHYYKNNQLTTDIKLLIKEYLPENKLTANQYKYIMPFFQSFQEDQTQSLRIPLGTQDNSSLYQLKSEIIYYQKKVQEMEQQNNKLQDQMLKMKQEIEQKTSEFSKKEEQLLLKISTIEGSVKQFEQLDKGKEQEYNRKIQKLFKMFKERETQLQEKEKQYQDLYQVLKNFTFQNQYHSPQATQDPQTQNQQQIKAQTHQGFYRPSSLQNYPENTLVDNHKMKNSDSSMMTTQNSIMYVTGGMQQSQIVPLSDLESMNQSQSYQHNKFIKNNLQNYSTHFQFQQLQNPKFNDFQQNLSGKAVEIKGKDILANTNKLNTNDHLEMNINQNQPVTKIHGVIDDEDMESAIMGNFLTFNDTSKIFEDCTQDYKEILTNFFELSPFKKMNLELIYRASRDKLTKQTFDEKVCGVFPSVVFIKSWEYFKIFGAYLSVPWSIEQGYQQDENAFLFSISENVKIPVKNSESALYQGEEHIFSFGTSDLSIFENGDQDENNKSEYPGDYQEIKIQQNIPLNSLLAGNKNFQIDELEVFKIIIQEDMDF